MSLVLAQKLVGHCLDQRNEYFAAVVEEFAVNAGNVHQQGLGANVSLILLQPVQVTVALKWISADVELGQRAIGWNSRYAQSVWIERGDTIAKEIDAGDVRFLEERISLDLSIN